MNVAVIERYFLNRPFDIEGKQIQEYGKRMHDIWKKRQDLKVTERRLCGQARMIIGMNRWLTKQDINVIKKAR